MEEPIYDLKELSNKLKLYSDFEILNIEYEFLNNIKIGLKLKDFNLDKFTYAKMLSQKINKEISTEVEIFIL